MTDQKILLPHCLEQSYLWMISAVPAWWQVEIKLADKFYLAARATDSLGQHQAAEILRDRASNIYSRVTAAYLDYAKETEKTHT